SCANAKVALAITVTRSTPACRHASRSTAAGPAAIAAPSRITEVATARHATTAARAGARFVPGPDARAGPCGDLALPADQSPAGSPFLGPGARSAAQRVWLDELSLRYRE